MKRKTIIVSLIILVGIALFGFTIHLFLERNMGNSQTITKDNFILTYIYRGNNTWNYTVTEAVSTSCVHIKTDAIVMESYPEQVNITVEKLDEPTVEVCSVAQDEYSSSGTFSASSLAKVSLGVK